MTTVSPTLRVKISIAKLLLGLRSSVAGPALVRCYAMSAGLPARSVSPAKLW